VEKSGEEMRDFAVEIGAGKEEMKKIH